MREVLKFGIFDNSWIYAGVNLYYMDYTDQLVVTGQLSDTGNPMSVNVPDSYRAGIELSFGLQPCSWFNWKINATLSKNRIKNFTEIVYEEEWTNPISIEHGDVPIAFSPDFTLNNSFDFAWKGLDATLQTQYEGLLILNNTKNKIDNGYKEYQKNYKLYIPKKRSNKEFNTVSAGSVAEIELLANSL